MSSMKGTDLQLQQQRLDTARTRVEHCGNQILRVRGDSDSDMEALFSVLQGTAPATGSLKNRRLPASFFQPPEPRPPPCRPLLGLDRSEGGGDGAAVCRGLLHPGTESTSTTHTPVISHSRSRSSPVQLLRSHGASHRHFRQSSADGCTDEFVSSHPATWDVDTNCPRYQMKYWPQDMHSGYDPLTDQSQHHVLSHQQLGIHHNHSLQSVDLSKHQDFGPFPHGWEQGLTPEGELYFINHVDKTTSWYDPRLPCHAHSVAPVMICQTLQPFERLVSQRSDYLSQAQLMPNSTSLPPPALHPSANDQFLSMQLHKIQQEKERIKQEQEAIACKEMMLNELVRHSASSGGDMQVKCLSSGCALNLGQVLQSNLCASGLDPFLSKVGRGTAESHVRQNSTDSGLDGMGANYSLPRSPDDYLNNAEETDGNHKLPMPHNSCCGNSNVGLEMTTVAEMADILEDEHIITSLGEDLENEFFDEMDVQKINNLLWL